VTAERRRPNSEGGTSPPGTFWIRPTLPVSTFRQNKSTRGDWLAYFSPHRSCLPTPNVYSPPNTFDFALASWLLVGLSKCDATDFSDTRSAGYTIAVSWSFHEGVPKPLGSQITLPWTLGSSRILRSNCCPCKVQISSTCDVESPPLPDAAGGTLRRTATLFPVGDGSRKATFLGSSWGGSIGSVASAAATSSSSSFVASSSSFEDDIGITYRNCRRWLPSTSRTDRVAVRTGTGGPVVVEEEPTWLLLTNALDSSTVADAYSLYADASSSSLSPSSFLSSSIARPFRIVDGLSGLVVARRSPSPPVIFSAGELRRDGRRNESNVASLVAAAEGTTTRACDESLLLNESKIIRQKRTGFTRSILRAPRADGSAIIMVMATHTVRGADVDLVLDPKSVLLFMTLGDATSDWRAKEVEDQHNADKAKLPHPSHRSLTKPRVRSFKNVSWMGCCASLFGCYEPTDSVVVVGPKNGNPDGSSTKPHCHFPPPRELYGFRALESEVVHLLVQNSPGKIVKRRFRNGPSYKHHHVEVAACSHIIVTDQRLLVLFKPAFGGSANLAVRWDNPRAHDIRVEVVEDKRPSGRHTNKKAAAVDLLVLRWDHGAVLQLPSCSGLVEARLRTPHATLIRDAILEQRKKQKKLGVAAAAPAAAA
jgi:hypothetical protein